MQQKAGAFADWCKRQQVQARDLFPHLNLTGRVEVNLGKNSLWWQEGSFDDLDFMGSQFAELALQHPRQLLAGGYLEDRPFYTAASYYSPTHHTFRSIHLGVDYWVPAETALHAALPGQVVSLRDNAGPKDYGPTLILAHKPADGPAFFTLYGHLSRGGLDLFRSGDLVKQGQLLGFIGHAEENGGWVPHLHLQIMLDLLDFEGDFPGVAFPHELEKWRALCPDPELLFR